MAYQLFVQPQGSTAGYVQLDIREADPVSLNFSVSSVEDPGSNVSAYSQSFTIPHTAANGQFFVSLSNHNAIDFDPSLKLPAYLMSEGLIFTEGYIVLNSVTRNILREEIDYEIQYFGEISSFASGVADKQLNALDLGALDHLQTTDNIVTSWNDIIVGSTAPYENGYVRYPLMEWGYAYNSVPQPVVSTISVGASQSFTNPGKPQNPYQMKPGINVKYLWDQVFEEAGDYTYTSTFLNSDLFKSLYFVTDAEARITVDPLSLIRLRSAQDTYPISLATGSYESKPKVPWRTQELPVGAQLSSVQLDNVTPGSYFLPPDNSVFTSAIASDVFIGVRQGRAVSGVGTTPPSVWFNMHLVREGLPTLFVASTTPMELTYYQTILNSEARWDIFGTNQPQINDGGQKWSTGMLAASGGTQTLTALGGYYQVVITMNILQGSGVKAYDPINGASYFKYADIVNTNWPGAYDANVPAKIKDGTWEITLDSQITVPTNQIPDTVKQIDFIKSIATKFKLQFAPDKENPKNFFIEPWIDWALAGDYLDWTEKLDISQDFVVKPLFTTQSREMEFLDSEDTDYVNEAYQKNRKVVFGRRKLDSGIEILRETNTINTIFAPTPLTFIGNSSDWVLPHLAKVTAGSNSNNDGGTAKYEPVAPKPRLLFWNGTVSVPSGATAWYLGAGGAQYTYPLMTSFQEWPVLDDTLCLDWVSPSPVYTGLVGATAINTQSSYTVYDKYWSDWYAMNYDTQGKIATCTFRLDNKDIYNFKFNDRVWVRDAYWFITNINGFVLGEINLCECEMIKIPDIAAFQYALPVNTCAAITYAIFANGPTGATGATVNFTASTSTHQSYTFEWTGATNTGLTGSLTGANAPTAFLTPLYDDTDYNVRVKTICDPLSTTSAESPWFDFYHTGYVAPPPPTPTVSWNLYAYASGSTFDIYKNGGLTVSVTSNAGGTFSAIAGDTIQVNITATTSPHLYAQTDLNITNNGYSEYANTTSALGNTSDSHTFVITGFPCTITGETYEF